MELVQSWCCWNFSNRNNFSIFYRQPDHRFIHRITIIWTTSINQHIKCELIDQHIIFITWIAHAATKSFRFRSGFEYSKCPYKYIQPQIFRHDQQIPFWRKHHHGIKKTQAAGNKAWNIKEKIIRMWKQINFAANFVDIMQSVKKITTFAERVQKFHVNQKKRSILMNFMKIEWCRLIQRIHTHNRIRSKDIQNNSKQLFRC